MPKASRQNRMEASGIPPNTSSTLKGPAETGFYKESEAPGESSCLARNIMLFGNGKHLCPKPRGVGGAGSRSEVFASL